MEDFNSTSQNDSYDYSDITSDYTDYVYAEFILNVLTWIIISVSLPLTLVAIYAVSSLVRKDHVAPIYLINLLISDLIQLCCMIIRALLNSLGRDTGFSQIHICSLVVSVGFMVCVALERYLVITWPLWYRCKRTIKTSVVLSVLIWVLLPAFFFFIKFLDAPILILIFFLPFTLLIFFLGGTLRALSASRLPSDEKRRIVGSLVLVLLIYMLLFLPAVTTFLTQSIFHVTTAIIFLYLSPLADVFLYVFMKKGIIDRLLASVCCCRMDSDEI